MAYSLYVKKQKESYQRRFFIEDKNTNEIPYRGIIHIVTHNEFTLESRNIFFKEEIRSHCYSLKADISDILNEIIKIENPEKGKSIVNFAPSDFFDEVEKLPTGIEQLLRDGSFKKENLKRFGRFLVRRAILSSK